MVGVNGRRRNNTPNVGVRLEKETRPEQYNERIPKSDKFSKKGWGQRGKKGRDI